MGDPSPALTGPIAWGEMTSWPMRRSAGRAAQWKETPWARESGDLGFCAKPDFVSSADPRKITSVLWTSLVLSHTCPFFHHVMQGRSSLPSHGGAGRSPLLLPEILSSKHGSHDCHCSLLHGDFQSRPCLDPDPMCRELRRNLRML